MSNARVTIVVVPRERFSYTTESLESIYTHTQLPFELIYVDGNSPAPIKRYLEQQAQERNFQLIRTEHYLSPNYARNLGRAFVQTEYLAFVDNDVIVAPGWLERMIQCSDETQATVVGPLMCQDQPVHETVHFAGGESHIWTDVKGRRRLREKMYDQGKTVAQVKPRLTRQTTELAEFHCMLVRTTIFDAIGGLDEAFLNTKEHLDFCMSVREAGGTVYFEPSSLVTYVPGPPLKFSDIPFYALRWSDSWTLSSLHRLRDKWNLSEDGYFTTKYKKLGWRRRATIIGPVSRRLTLGLGSRWIIGILGKLDKILNFYWVRYHARTLTPSRPSEL